MAKVEIRSRGTIALILAIAAPLPWIGALMGNHQGAQAETLASPGPVLPLSVSLPSGSNLTIGGQSNSRVTGNSFDARGDQTEVRDGTALDTTLEPSHWWWLLLPVAGASLLGVGWFLKKNSASRHRAMAGPVETMATDLSNSDHSRLVMIAKDSHQAYAFWELSETDQQFLANHAEMNLKLRVYDVTLNSPGGHSFQELDCDRHQLDCQVPIKTANRSYIAQLGYNTPTGEWTKLATSSPVNIPAPPPSVKGFECLGKDVAPKPTPNARVNHEARTPPVQRVAPPETRQNPKHSVKKLTHHQTSQTVIPFTQGVSYPRSSWINLIPHNSHQGEVTWHLSEAQINQLSTAGQQAIVLRVHDAQTLRSEKSSQILEVVTDIQTQAMTVDLPLGDRDYVAELGYYTVVHRWVSLVHSSHSHLPKADQDGARVMIMPCDPYHLSQSREKASDGPKAYIYWDISSERKALTRARGGNILVVRVYGHVEGDRTTPTNYRQLSETIIQEDDRDRVIALPEGDRNYRAEVGYLTIQGQFLSLGQSAPILIPSVSIR